MGFIKKGLFLIKLNKLKKLINLKDIIIGSFKNFVEFYFSLFFFLVFFSFLLKLVVFLFKF
ncbi:MAG: hypothetical protein MJ232_07650, partial [archaeon]|nr:hypothetical protein [archaeon]